MRNDPRLSFAGEYVTWGTSELHSSLSLGRNEYHYDVTAVYPTISQLKEGRLPETPMEIALPEDALQYLGFTGHLGDTIPLTLIFALIAAVSAARYAAKVSPTVTMVGRNM